MRTRIGTRLILGAGLTIALAFSLMAVVVVREHRSALTEELKRGANQLSETIKSSTYHDMLENRRDNLRRQIETIGGQAGIAQVRLFNKDGAIVFASDPGEVGRVFDKANEACVGCHGAGKPPVSLSSFTERSRIFRGPDDQRVLGIINPIQNQPSCWTASCHAHSEKQKVLGILDVTVPLAEVDRQIGRSQARMAGLALLAIVLTSIILWWLSRRLVLRPVATLTAGIRRVASGDLTTNIPSTAGHELGELARAFNQMTTQLAEAQRQLTQADKLASVGRLAAGIAHEINNPLTGVLTYASFLLKRSEGNPQAKEDLGVIVRETKRCREIVKGLLDFARQTPPRRQPSDLNEVARRAVTVVMNQLTLNRVSLSLDLAGELPPVPMDANQIQQVLVNLLVNAADAVGTGGGSITITTRQASLPAWGHTPIRKAHCPRGCDLLDGTLKIGGASSIHVTGACGGRSFSVHLDPLYGRFNDQAIEACEDGQFVSYSCAHCRTSLESPGVRCATCGAPAFDVQVPGKGPIHYCSRKGCHWANWPAEEAAGPQRVAELSVQDSGCGISAETLQNLFEPFFSTKGTRGTGLGLAISWGIVEGHGGTIDVVSKVDGGTRFTVRLPLAGAAAPPAPIARETVGAER